MSVAEISQVIGLYPAVLDAHAWDLFDAVFTQDVDADYTGSGHWHDLVTFKRGFAELHEPTAGHQHFLGAPQILLRGGDRAFCLTYGRVIFFRTTPARNPGEMFECGTWYDDELVRTDAGWRINKRTTGNFWFTGLAAPEDLCPRIVNSFPEWARTGTSRYLNALRGEAEAN